MDNLFSLLTNVVTNITVDDSIFDNFIEQVNSIPFTHYPRQEPMDDNTVVERIHVNENIIENIHYIRRSFELNFQQRLQREQLQSFRVGTRLNELGNIFNNFIDNAYNAYNNEDVKVTLSEDEFNKLNTINKVNFSLNYSHDLTNESLILDESKLKECSICLDKLTLNDTLVLLKCGHIYHKNCIKEWLCNQSTKCCICRCDQR